MNDAKSHPDQQRVILVLDDPSRHVPQIDSGRTSLLSVIVIAGAAFVVMSFVVGVLRGVLS